MNTNTGSTIEMNAVQNTEIDTRLLGASRNRTALGLIQPGTEELESISIVDHASEPIKNMEDIFRISEFLLSSGRYRDNMLFICGINFGLRIGDLLRLRFADLIDEQFNFKESFPIQEQKTKNTRKRKMNRYVTINDAAMDAILLYLQHTPGTKLSDYMFRAEGNRGKNLGQPMNQSTAYRILVGIEDELKLGIKMSTHSLRKTWGYWQMTLSGNDPRTLLLVQKSFGHSSSSQTLTYIGITKDEIAEAYKRLNLGARFGHPMLVNKTEFREVIEGVA